MNAKYPVAAVLCNIVGVIAAISGFAITWQVIAERGSDAGIGFGFATFLSSVLWFAIASALSMLSKIEFNTRKLVPLPRNPPKSAGLQDSSTNSP